MLNIIDGEYLLPSKPLPVVDRVTQVGTIVNEQRANPLLGLNC